MGKAAALQAGFDAAAGDYIITMDADLQDDPAEIPALTAALESGLDMVSGWKKNKQENHHYLYDISHIPHIYHA